MGLVVAALLAGFVALTVGGDLLVTGATSLARRLGLSAAVVGATVVATATSAPELAVSVGAAVHGDPGLALGNVVGSNIANVLLVLGAAAVLAPVRVPSRMRRVDLPVCIGASVLLLMLALDGEIGRVDGLVLLAVVVASTTASVRSSRRGEETPDDAGAETVPHRPVWAGLWRLLVGTAALVAGAELLVYGAGTIARDLGVSEVVVGLTVVAIGTSLPELAAAVSAGRSGQADLAVGNAVGSNVANLGLVLGLPALFVTPIPVPVSALRQDVPLAVLAAVVLGVLAWWRGGLGRGAGVAFLTAYALYLASLAFSATG